MQRTDTSDGSSIRMTYNGISLPTGLHYTVAGTGSRNVYYTYADRDNLPKKTSFGTDSAYSAEHGESQPASRLQKAMETLELRIHSDTEAITGTKNPACII